MKPGPVCGGHLNLLCPENVHGVGKLLERIAIQEEEVSRWLAEREWSDSEEYLESRFGALRRVPSVTGMCPKIDLEGDHTSSVD